MTFKAPQNLSSNKTTNAKTSPPMNLSKPLAAVC